MDAQFMAEVALLNAVPPDFAAIATKLNVFADSEWLEADSNEGEMFRRIAREASCLAERGSARGRDHRTDAFSFLGRNRSHFIGRPAGGHLRCNAQASGKVARYLKPES